MPGAHIRKDDQVRVMTGKSRGHVGRVVTVQPSEGRVLVEGAALAKKHARTSGKRSSGGQQLQQGGIIDKELFIDISNVQLVCKSCSQPTRPGYRMDDDGTKTRICRKCEAEL